MTTTKEESASRIGTHVNGKWRLDALIGYSPVAATYKATHRNGLAVAIKIIHRTQGTFSGVVDRFLQEAHLANRIDHPGVERIFDDGTTEDGCVFLVMEQLEGESLELRRVSAGGKLEPQVVRPIVDRLLDVLIAIHGAGVVHRNLKPGNVFLTRDDRVVLTDFGRARLADGDPNAPFSLDGVVSGTPAYMAPEQARGRRKEVDAQSDIWSAGAIMFTLLTGRRVHRGKTPQEKLTSAQTKRAPPMAYVMPGVDPALAAVVDKALAFDKKDRWASVSEMRRAYWIATGRAEKALPPEAPVGERAKPKIIPTPATGWESIPFPETKVDKKIDLRVPRESFAEPDLLPPSIDAFVEQPKEPPPPKSAELARVGRLALVGIFVIAFVAFAAMLILILYSKD